MPENPESPRESKPLVVIGSVLGILPSLMLFMSAGMKISNNPQVVEGFGKLGYPANIAVGLGCVELTCAILYLIPQTAVLGAILLTGYLGGAISAHVRLGESYVFIVILAMLLWGGLYLRDRRVRALIPFR